MLSVLAPSEVPGRVRLAVKLFDSEGVALVNLLRNGSGALEEMRERARDLGIADLSSWLADLAGKAGIAWERLFDAPEEKSLRTLRYELDLASSTIEKLEGRIQELRELPTLGFTTFHRGCRPRGRSRLRGETGAGVRPAARAFSISPSPPASERKIELSSPGGRAGRGTQRCRGPCAPMADTAKLTGLCRVQVSGLAIALTTAN